MLMNLGAGYVYATIKKNGTVISCFDIVKIQKIGVKNWFGMVYFISSTLARQNLKKFKKKSVICLCAKYI